MKARHLLAILLASCLTICVAITATAGVNQWTTIGPKPGDRLHVQNFVVDPSNPDTLYATTDGPERFWRSKDRGLSWESVRAPDRPQQVAVDALNHAPILFLGFFGLYQSYDGGETWSDKEPAPGLLCGITIRFDGSRDWSTIYLVGTPGAADIYPCFGAAVARSTDGGRNWTRAGLDNEVIHLLKVDPIDPRIVYATSIHNNQTEGKLFRTHFGTSGTALNPIAAATSASYTTLPLTSTTSYWVRVSNPYGSPADSNTATIKIYLPFTDDTLIPGSSLIRLVHLAELRQRIDALRTRFALAPFSWTDTTPAAGITTIRAQHVTDLRAALSQAYVAAALTPPVYVDPVLAPGIMVKAAHIVEIRANVVSLELH
jgi:hypothetical protein